MYFYESNILYFSRFSIQFSFTKLKAVFFKLRGPKVYSDGHRDIIVDIYNNFYKQTFSVRSSISEL